MSKMSFDSVTAIHALLNELPKAAQAFLAYREKELSIEESIGDDPDGAAQIILFTEKLSGLNVPKRWRKTAKYFYRAAAHKLAINARNPLDRLAEVKKR